MPQTWLHCQYQGLIDQCYMRQGSMRKLLRKQPWGGPRGLWDLSSRLKILVYMGPYGRATAFWRWNYNTWRGKSLLPCGLPVNRTYNVVLPYGDHHISSLSSVINRAPRERSAIYSFGGYRSLRWSAPSAGGIQDVAISFKAHLCSNHISQPVVSF